jgi:hypothetical protein
MDECMALLDPIAMFIGYIGIAAFAFNVIIVFVMWLMCGGFDPRDWINKEKRND